MIKHFYFKPNQKETVDSWLSENIGLENFRWWSQHQILPLHEHDEKDGWPFVDVFQKYTIELTEEEEPMLAWFILTFG